MREILFSSPFHINNGFSLRVFFPQASKSHRVFSDIPPEEQVAVRGPELRLMKPPIETQPRHFFKRFSDLSFILFAFFLLSPQLIKNVTAEIRHQAPRVGLIIYCPVC